MDQYTGGTPESFCDFIGLRLFQQSYIYAFFYLLAPWGDTVTCRHDPSTSDKFESFQEATQVYGFDYPDGIGNITEACCRDSHCKLCKVRGKITPQLIAKADEIIAQAKSNNGYNLFGTPEEVRRIARMLSQMVPATEIKSLADIVNAGWEVYTKIKNDNLGRKEMTAEILMDIVAKNFEIFSIENRIGRDEVI